MNALGIAGQIHFLLLGVYVQTYWFGVFAIRGLWFYPPLVFLKGLRGYLRWRGSPHQYTAAGTTASHAAHGWECWGGK